MIRTDYFAWLACFGQLGLAALSMVQSRHRPAGRLVTLLSLSLFSWNFAALTFAGGGSYGWRIVELMGSPTTPPLALHLVLALVGKSRKARAWLTLSYVAFGSLSAATALSFFSAGLASWVEAYWSIAATILGVPLLSFIVLALARHFSEAVEREERVLVSLLLLAFGIGGLMLLTEPANDYFPWLPGLGALGALIFSSMLSLVVVRYGLLGEEPGEAGRRYAGPLATIGLAIFVSLEAVMPLNETLRVVASLVLTLILLAAIREVLFHVSQNRERVQRLAFLGRFSAQLAHDMRNPLAALKGAVEYLRDENDPNERAQFLDLMADQVVRMQAVLEGYGRIGRLELEPQLISINPVVADVVRAQSVAWSRPNLEFVPADGLPLCNADPKLLGIAIENLIRNAMQACGNGEPIVVRTARALEANAIAIQVTDEGVGIHASDTERVFDEFYTTREEGSGLGLHLVRRIARAHGGEVTLKSRRGKGTTVSFRLPTSSVCPKFDHGLMGVGRN